MSRSRLTGAINRAVATGFKTKYLALKTARPLVSFTFDDAPLSAATIGADILEAEGALGTYYIAGGLCGGEELGRKILAEADVVRLNETGHELACHTFSHARVSTLSSTAFAEETTRNQTFIAELCGDVRLNNFSYPFGDVSLARKRQAQSAFASARGIAPGVNSGLVDLGLLKAVSIYSQGFDEIMLEAYLDRVGKVGGWLIFYTHDIETDPSPWGTTPAHLREVVRSTIRHGCEILSVRNALGRLAASLYT